MSKTFSIEEFEELEKEMDIPKIPKMDLTSFLKIKEKHPEMRIGILKKEVNCFNSYKKGDAVLFTPYSLKECYGTMLWEDMKRHVRHCTIEVPSERYFKGESKVATIGTVTNVPLSFIDYELIV